MKKLNKKGFTIVELVIVIAVIAILAAVLIPTFSGVVEKANASSRQQMARNAMTSVLAEESTDGTVPSTFDIYVINGSTWVKYTYANNTLGAETDADSFEAPVPVTAQNAENYKVGDTVYVSSSTTTFTASYEYSKESDETNSRTTAHEIDTGDYLIGKEKTAAVTGVTVTDLSDLADGKVYVDMGSNVWYK